MVVPFWFKQRQGKAEQAGTDTYRLTAPNLGETFIGISEIPRALRGAVNGYLKRCGVEVTPRFGIDNFAMAMTLVTSERGVALLPISIEDYLPPSIVSRRLKGEQPTVDLVIGYHKANASPILKMFLSRLEGLKARASSPGGG